MNSFFSLFLSPSSKSLFMCSGGGGYAQSKYRIWQRSARERAGFNKVFVQIIGSTYERIKGMKNATQLLYVVLIFFYPLSVCASMQHLKT